MFNLFKSKIELKTSNNIMSSFHNTKGLKFGSEIIVPESHECLIYFNGKLFNTLNHGKHLLDNKNFEKLISRQKNKKGKIKYVKCVCHFINLAPQKLEFRFKKEKYIADFTISNTLSFANLMLLYNYKIDNAYTYSYLQQLFNELLAYYKGEYKAIDQDKLSNCGITINNILPKNKKTSIFDNNPSTSEPNISDIENPLEATEELDNTTSSNTPQPLVDNPISSQINASNEPSSSVPHCPKCRHIAKFTTAYCLKCGHKLQ